MCESPGQGPPVPPPQGTALARLQAPASTHLHSEDPQPHLDLPREMRWALRVAQHAALRNGRVGRAADQPDLWVAGWVGE